MICFCYLSINTDRDRDTAISISNTQADTYNNTHKYNKRTAAIPYFGVGSSDNFVVLHLHASETPKI